MADPQLYCSIDIHVLVKPNTWNNSYWSLHYKPVWCLFMPWFFQWFSWFMLIYAMIFSMILVIHAYSCHDFFNYSRDSWLFMPWFFSMTHAMIFSIILLINGYSCHDFFNDSRDSCLFMPWFFQWFSWSNISLVTNMQYSVLLLEIIFSRFSSIFISLHSSDNVCVIIVRIVVHVYKSVHTIISVKVYSWWRKCFI